MSINYIRSLSLINSIQFSFSDGCTTASASESSAALGLFSFLLFVKLSKDLCEAFIVKLHVVLQLKSSFEVLLQLSNLRLVRAALVPDLNGVKATSQVNDEAKHLTFVGELVTDQRQGKILPELIGEGLGYSDTPFSAIDTLLVFPDWLDTFSELSYKLGL